MSPQGAGRVPYHKPWLSCAEQIDRLIARGLVVTDRPAAEAFLSHVNYYRFSGYVLPFEQARHQFHDGATFETVRATYEFDLGLRDIVTDALELLEVDFRAAIASHFGRAHGAFGHVRSECFFHTFRHAEWLTNRREEAQRSNESFVDHFRLTYAEFPDLPIWMLMEVVSFGGLSQMYKGMHRKDQKSIASRYRMQPRDLGTVFHHLAYVRNLCAHHSRLWNRVWAIRPELPKGKAWLPPLLPGNDRLFASLLLQYHLMKQCPGIDAARESWRDRVWGHLASPPKVPDSLAKMGMPAAWQANPIWT